jgi:hypothetical protein
MSTPGNKLAKAFGDAAENMARFNLTWRKGERLESLRRRAEHFATPSWQRPFHRLRVRYFMWRHYRHVS